MSKLYKKYLKEKSKDKETLYLFKSGIFYIFIEEDALIVNKITNLSLTKLNDNIYKCGFPINSLNKYINILNRNGLNIKVIEDIESIIKNIDIDNITPIKAINILKEIKELYE